MKNLQFHNPRFITYKDDVFTVDILGGVDTQQIERMICTLRVTYQYVYDGRSRLVEKQVAGKEVEYIVYNKLDQPILTQDANQRVNSEWLFTLYDAFGRISYTRKDIDNPKSREELQILADAHAQQFVTQTGTATTYAGTPVYYTKDAFPGSFDQVLTIHDYDSYVDTDGLSIPSQIYGVPKATGIGTKGLSTVSKIRVLGTDQWITTIIGYDKKGKVIYSGEQNDYLNTTMIIQNDLDFVGKVEESKTQHRKGTGTWIVTVDKYSYDHSGRLADHYQCIGERSIFGVRTKMVTRQE